MTRTDRYTFFSDSDPVTVRLSLEHLPKSHWRVREAFISEDEGSVYDAWIRSGAPEVLSAEEEQYLRNAARPGYREHMAETDGDGPLNLCVTLKLLVVRLITIEPAASRM